MEFRITIMPTTADILVDLGELSVSIADATNALELAITTEADIITVKIEELQTANPDLTELQAIADSIDTIKTAVQKGKDDLTAKVQAILPPDLPPSGVVVSPTPEIPPTPTVDAPGTSSFNRSN
jgi:hypothetical protein